MPASFFRAFAVHNLLLTCCAGAVLAEVPRFTDITESAGIRFLHVNGPVERKDYIFEAKGGGVGLFDYDNDGWLDIFLVQGATVETVGTDRNGTSRLYRNRRDGTFQDVTESAGLSHRGWGMGVAFADYDGDGWTDIYVTCLGPNVLYRNNGDGTFTDVTARAGVGDPRWSTSAAFADYDGDGLPDLYVANYIDVSPQRLPPRSSACTYLGKNVMCGPRGLPGAHDVLYRNRGDGTFVDVTREAGVAVPDPFYGLGVIWTDLDQDGDLDLFVANDATPNLFFVNDGRGRFEEMGFLSGLAVSGDGAMQASMGIDVADYDNDGRLDLFSTHFASDYSTLYRQQGPLSFRDVSGEARIQQSEWLLVAWGVRFVDLNHDGWKDLVHVNGHVYPFLAEGGFRERYAQPGSLYMNLRDGTFREAAAEAGPDFTAESVARGAAFGDIDNDGDIDILVAVLGGSPRLLRNDRTESRYWVMIRTAGDGPNPERLGSRIRVTAGGLSQLGEVRRTVGIYSAGDPRVHFGLGEAGVIDQIEVFWPDGTVTRYPQVPAGRHYLIHQAKGIGDEPIARP